MKFRIDILKSDFTITNLPNTSFSRIEIDTEDNVSLASCKIEAVNENVIKQILEDYINCNDCHLPIDITNDVVYCESCFEDKENKIEELEENIEDLKDKIFDLEKEIEKFK